jgi:hypothetical protein
VGKLFVSLLLSIFLLSFVQAEVINLGLGRPAETLKSETQRTFVDTLIVIAVDVSASINDKEYDVQKNGIISAFSDPSIKNLLRQCSARGIGVTYMEWSGYAPSHSSVSVNPFNQVIPWTHLQAPRDMDAFANQLLLSQRSSHGATDIVGSLEFSRDLMASAPFESSNRIVSLSTDGRQSFTTKGISAEDFLKTERDKVASLGIAINAIGIDVVAGYPEESIPAGGVGFFMSEEESLRVYLEKNVRSGPGSYVESVPDFEAYSEAFKKQLYVMMNACIS